MKKAFLIDTIGRTIRPVEVDGLRDIYNAMGVSLITTATYLENGDVVFVDDEGLYNKNRNWFTIEGGHHPFIGNALVIGTDFTTGESVDAKSTIEELTEAVGFLHEWEVAATVSALY